MNNKRTSWIIMILAAVMEIIFIYNMYGGESKLTFLLGVIAIPLLAIGTIVMLSSLKNAFYIFAFIMPLMPISGYIFLRLNILNYQWIAYMGLYFLFIISFCINRGFQKVNINKFNYKKNFLVIILFLIVIINVVSAYNKQFSIFVFLNSFLPFGIFAFLVETIELEKSRDKFLNNLLLALCTGAVLSSLPDFFYFLILLKNGMKDYRIFGPLGSNYILSYILLLFPIMLNKLTKEQGIRKKIWIILITIQSICFFTQLSRGAFFSIILMAIIMNFDYKNLKIYIPIFLVLTIVMGYNVYMRPDVKKSIEFQMKQSKIDSNKLKTTKDDNLVKKFISSQTGTRKVLWLTGINIAEDYPILGVGLSNYAFFFDEYSGTDLAYLDAHSFIINSAAEMGYLFTIGIIFLLGWGIVMSIIMFFKEKNRKLKLNYLTMVCIIGVFLLYGNITGMSFAAVHEIYSFTPTFVLIYLLVYYNNIREIG